jgi:hypothetical protein
MNYTTERQSGIALILFVILLAFTMVLHPAGGNIQHLIRITNLIVVTHSIAILSLPFGWMGFRGLTHRLGAGNFYSMLALVLASLALIAVLLAAAANGLIMPVFLQNYKDATPETETAFKPILQYGFAVNKAFDYIYTGALCLAILCWSISIWRTRKLPGWLGWLGMVSVILVLTVFISGVAINSLLGVRLFAAGIVAWLLLVGRALVDRAGPPDGVEKP